MRRSWSPLFTLLVLAVGGCDPPAEVGEPAGIDAAEHDITARASCTKIRVRKSWRLMTSAERAAFLGAVKQLQARPGGQLSIYDGLVKKWGAAVWTFDGYPQFLPWTRKWLRNVELELQKIDPNVTIPYWDWDHDAGSPHLAAVWGTGAFGGNGKAGDCVVDGKFAGYQVKVPQAQAGCLRRDWDLEPALSGFDSIEAVTSYVVGGGGYDEFLNHAIGSTFVTPFVAIGGHMNTKSGAPNDPLGLLVLAQTDRLWHSWQARGGWSNYAKYAGTNKDGTPAALADSIVNYGVSVSSVLDITAHCYAYDTRVGG